MALFGCHDSLKIKSGHFVEFLRSSVISDITWNSGKIYQDIRGFPSFISAPPSKNAKAKILVSSK